jgi:hypothetical protein
MARYKGPPRQCHECKARAIPSHRWYTTLDSVPGTLWVCNNCNSTLHKTGKYRTEQQQIRLDGIQQRRKGLQQCNNMGCCRILTPGMPTSRDTTDPSGCSSLCAPCGVYYKEYTKNRPADVCVPENKRNCVDCGSISWYGPLIHFSQELSVGTVSKTNSISICYQ